MEEQYSTDFNHDPAEFVDARPRIAFLQTRQRKMGKDSFKNTRGRTCCDVCPDIGPNEASQNGPKPDIVPTPQAPGQEGAAPEGAAPSFLETATSTDSTPINGAFSIRNDGCCNFCPAKLLTP